MTAPALDLTDQIRRAYAAADAAGQPRPGRPALIALTGAPERQVRRAMREAGHLAPVPDVQSSAALDTIPVQASRDLDTAGHPGASSADRSDVQASSDAHDGTVQAATAERLDVHPAPAGHPAAGDLDTWTTQLDADASSDLDGPFAVDMLIAQQDTRLDNSRDAAVSSGASTALDSQVNGLDAPVSSGPVQAAGNSVQADQPVTAPRVDWTPLDARPGRLDTTTSSALDTPASSTANAGQSSDVQPSNGVQLDAQDPAAPATLDTPAERLDAPVSSGLDQTGHPVQAQASSLVRWLRRGLFVIALPAFVATWSGWVGVGELTGFGPVNLLPGFGDGLTVNSAITLPLGVEAYVALAMGAWLSGVPMAAGARRFAMVSSLISLSLGMGAQVAYHLIVAGGAAHSAPWGVTVVVSCLPNLVMGMAAALIHLLRKGRGDDGE